MNILYLCQVFELAHDAGSDRHFFFCKYAKNKGYNVTAITSNVDYKNACVKFEGKKATVSRTIDGVDIHYVYSFADFRGSFLKRFYYYITYFFSSIKQSFKVKDVDAIYAVSTPLSVGLLGYVISRMRRVPFVFEVTDVWPDAPIACGVVKNRVLIKLAKWLEIFCYNKAIHIVGLTHGICQNIIQKGVSPNKITEITNGVDFSLFHGHENDKVKKQFRDKLVLDQKFVAMYMGAHGAYNALHTIIDAAILLRNDSRIVFVFIGDGDEKIKLRQRVNDLQLTNVVFHDPVPRDDSVSLLSTADVFLLPNRKGEFFIGNLPNKLFDFLAAARPVIVAGKGETADLVTKAGAGCVGEAENGEEMANSIVKFVNMPLQKRLDIGQKGRDYVMQNFNRITLSEKFLQVISNAIQNNDR